MVWELLKKEKSPDSVPSPLHLNLRSIYIFNQFIYIEVILMWWVRTQPSSGSRWWRELALDSQRWERAQRCRAHCRGQLQSWPAGDSTVGRGNIMCTDSMEARNDVSVHRESVHSLWSVSGAVGFEVRHVLNVKGFECLAKKAVPSLWSQGREGSSSPVL